MTRERTTSWVAWKFLPIATALLLLPPALSTASVDPSGVGKPTPKDSAEIWQTSTEEIPAPERFEVLFEGKAVRDRETGVVWEQSPDPRTLSWEDAIEHCKHLDLGGRQGWRVPSVDELVTLVDTSVLGSPKLPSAHPFDTNCRLGGCVQSHFYWSGTPHVDNTSHAWLVCFCNGTVTRSNKHDDNHVWCVWGDAGAGPD